MDICINIVFMFVHYYRNIFNTWFILISITWGFQLNRWSSAYFFYSTYTYCLFLRQTVLASFHLYKCKRTIGHTDPRRQDVTNATKGSSPAISLKASHCLKQTAPFFKTNMSASVYRVGKCLLLLPECMRLYFALAVTAS